MKGFSCAGLHFIQPIKSFAEADGQHEEEAEIDVAESGLEWEDFAGGTSQDDDNLNLDQHDNVITPPLPVEEDAAHTGQQGGDTYEELVMKRVAEYVQQSQEYLESTDLARRVSRWHESVRPRLEAVERRRAFDVHGYGSKIISHFPSGERKTTLAFRDAVDGQDREEVCRYFLSTLMLANQYNVELTPQEESTRSPPKKTGKRSSNATVGKSGLQAHSLPMDDFHMTLLSTRRHHEEVMEYADRATREEEETSTLNTSQQRRPVSNKRQGGRGAKRKRTRTPLEPLAEEET